jgi:N-acetylmuramic acid 6-phosphate etherase
LDIRPQGVHVKPKSDSDVFDELTGLTTEGRNPRSTDLDRMSPGNILRLINDEDLHIAEIVGGEIPYIEEVVELVIDAFRRGGRLIYVGAGTSGRIGVLDAAECPPTFGADPEMVQGIIAGGEIALVRAVEGAEDDAEAGAQAIRDKEVGADDVVMGIAASRRTPYVLSAVAEARGRGARTVYLTMNPRDSIDFAVDVAICPVVGPEVLMGSTRMKSGLAQKMVLTMITTTAFVRLGKTYENMMVDLMATSAKLRELAIVMIQAGVGPDEAARFLEQAGGFVRQAIEAKTEGNDS